MRGAAGGENMHSEVLRREQRFMYDLTGDKKSAVTRSFTASTMSWRGKAYRGAHRGQGSAAHRQGTAKRSRVEGPRTADALAQHLAALEGAPYPAYKDILGQWTFAAFTLHIDHVQADPFANPSQVRLQVPHTSAQFPSDLFGSKIRALGFADYLHRQVFAAVRPDAANARPATSGWSGEKGGDIRVDAPASQVVERTAVIVTESSIEARICVGLPAAGRTIRGHRARDLLTAQLPRLVESTLLASAYQPDGIRTIRSHVHSIEDQRALRAALQVHEPPLAAFVRNGAVLPRASGASIGPLQGSGVVPFRSPRNLEATFELPHSTVSGMALPSKSLVVCCGAGFHGKSTLLDALALGCYDHIPGDGREFVSAVANVSSVRSEDGRSISAVDLSNFIHDLPGGKSTTKFVTADASGSTSCAASMMEALEMGSELICIDEDTTASNWLACSPVMAQLLGKETIIPLERRAREVAASTGSTLFLVCGSSSDFLQEADLVLKMEDFAISDVTAEAKRLGRLYAPPQSHRNGQDETQRPTPPFKSPAPRQADFASAAVFKGKMASRGRKAIQFGQERNDEVHTLDLSAIPQVVSESQTRALIAAFRKLSGSHAGKRSLRDAVAELDRLIQAEGIDVLQSMNEPDGFLARPRPGDLAAALNRVRQLDFVQSA